MNQRVIGVIVVVFAILAGTLLFLVKAQHDADTALLIQARGGNCYLADGTCLHEQGNGLYIFGGAFTAALLALGVYLIIFDRAARSLERQHLEVSQALKEAKQQERQKDEFTAFLAGFSEEERTILSAVKEQDGIKQSTLRFRTGMSKTTLSLMLKSLEQRGIIGREEDGKTNKVWLRKKF